MRLRKVCACILWLPIFLFVYAGCASLCPIPKLFWLCGKTVGLWLLKYFQVCYLQEECSKAQRDRNLPWGNLVYYKDLCTIFMYLFFLWSTTNVRCVCKILKIILTVPLYSFECGLLFTFFPLVSRLATETNSAILKKRITSILSPWKTCLYFASVSIYKV